ncbi:hypothetical protein BJ912DRAFT_908859 [Pholiota molesta]|nr:hypothetical protein BJ912DRAFT_908859 [Pholiota molesta]
MYRKVNGGICGVLSDYDLSLFFNKPKAGPSSKQRTGTRPYMAIDLLQPTPTKHLYRHDLESLFYVILVLVTRYKKGKEIINKPPVQKWFQQSPIELREAKLAFFLSELPALHPPSKAWKTYCMIWCKCFIRALSLEPLIKS